MTRGRIRALRRKLTGDAEAVFTGRSAAPQVRL
jgi:hypothetical protein